MLNEPIVRIFALRGKHIQLFPGGGNTRLRGAVIVQLSSAF